MLNVESIDLFYGAAQALRGVSLKAAVGKVTCVLGRNGVGKSSLLRAIVGHQSISAGKIAWDDQDISRLAPHAGSRPFDGPGTTGPVDTNVFSPLSNARAHGSGRRRELRVSQRK